MKNLYLLVLLFILSVKLNAQNNALHFDGTTDYVSLATPLLPTASANDAWTVEIRMQTVSTVENVLLSQYITSGTNRSTFRITNTGKISYWKETLGTIVETPLSYNDGQWHHLALVKEGSGVNQVHLYMDGVLIVSGTDTLPMSTENTEIGRKNNTAIWYQKRHYLGKLDEVRVWNIARIQAEIDANKDTELVGTETGLTSYYNFNQGVANADNTGVATLTDSTSNANDGTLDSFSLDGTTSNWVGQYPQNNTCVTSTNITVSNTILTQSIEDVVFSSMTNETLCADPNPQNYYDLWYDFTLASDTNVYIYGNNQSYNRFVLYDACLGTEIVCFSNKKLLQLQAGINYKLRVFREESARLYGNKEFAIQSFDQPTNDACVDAENIVLTETLTNYNFDLRGATPDTEASCTAAGTYYDVWYDFTMPATPSNLYLKGRQYGGNKYAIYDTCGGTEVACFNAATTSYGSEILTNLTAGATYKLRVYRTEAHTGNPSGLVHNKFEIRTYPKIGNTTCATATNITVTTSNTNIATNFGGANLLENEVRCGSTDDYYDAWYTFTMPVSGNLTISSSASSWNKYELFDACAGTSITCLSGNATIQNLVAGTTYKLRISREETNVKWNPSGDNTFTLKALAIANNDTCANAENIAVSETENTVNFEIISAQLNTEEGCSGSATQSYADIWYNFTMPSFDGGSITQGNVLIDGIASYNKFAIYDACGGTEIDCFEDSKIIENLTSGTNYKIRVYRTAAQYTSSFYKSFTIKAFADVQNDDCVSSENIAVTTTATTINFELGGAASNLETICGIENTYVDVWYDFTVPEAGNIQITTSTTYNRFELLDACAGTQIGCFTGGNASFNNLASGTNYKLRVFRRQINNQGSGANFQISFQSTLGVDDFDLSNKVNIYPNPASGVININSQIEIDTVELYDLIGKKVLTSNQIEISIKHLKTGIYLLKITTNKGQLVKRIVIK